MNNSLSTEQFDTSGILVSLFLDKYNMFKWTKSEILPGKLVRQFSETSKVRKPEIQSD
jgi:hypothetical protein